MKTFEKQKILQTNINFIKFYLNSRKQKQQLLNQASDDQINFLIYFIHWVVTGEIEINKQIFNKIKKEKKLKFLEKHFNKNNFLKTEEKTRAQKLVILYKIIVLLPSLFKSLKK